MSQFLSSGDIVERQTYLNGTRYYLIEGEARVGVEAWSWTLALTLPKEEGEPIAEGDLSLVRPDRSWFGDIVAGAHHEAIDEALDAPVIEARVELERRTEAENTEPWARASATATLVADTCRLRFEANP